MVFAYIFVFPGDRKTCGFKQFPVLFCPERDGFQVCHCVVPDSRFGGRGEKQATAGNKYFGESLDQGKLIFCFKKKNQPDCRDGIERSIEES